MRTNESAEAKAVAAGAVGTTSMEVDSTELLTFSLAGEEYGIPILLVQEIRELEATTRIAGAPDTVRGVLNLRGTIVPILDLRRMLGMDFASTHGNAVVIVINHERKLLGLVVDGVTDVIRLSHADTRPVPSMAAVDTRHIQGIGLHEGRMLILLEMASVLGARPADCAVDSRPSHDIA